MLCQEPIRTESSSGKTWNAAPIRFDISHLVSLTGCHRLQHQLHEQIATALEYEGLQLGNEEVEQASQQSDSDSYYSGYSSDDEEVEVNGRRGQRTAK